MIRTFAFSALAIALLCGATPAPALTFDGAFVKTSSLSESALNALPQATISAKEEHADTAASYTGVTLANVLKAVGVPIGLDVKGAPARSYVVVHASDGYAAVFSVAELQQSATQCAPILTERANGMPIAASLGPWHIVAPCDATHARWVHEVTGFTVVTVPDTKK